MNGERHYLWRAVDQDGNILDILVQRRRDKHAAKKFFRKLLKGLASVPRVIITDKLTSYGAAKREILPDVEHRQPRYLNNRAENSPHPPGSGSGACRGSSHQGMPNGFSPRMVPSPNISARDATASLPRPLDKRWSNASRAGKKSQGSQQHR
jgi:hypothetical protein